jgi:ATP-dependent Clp protease, protease subunit
MIDVRDPATHDELLQRRVVVLNHEIDADRCKALIAKLLFLQHESRKDPIHLLVDSPGGGVIEGFAIIDTIDQLAPPTFTYCYGRADALAAIIVAHGAKSHRFAATTSRFSLSEPWSTKADAADAFELTRISSMLAQRLAADTGNSISQIQQDFAADACFDANAAQAYNLVDRVVERYPEFPLGV